MSDKFALKAFALIIVSFALLNCSRYQVSLNNQVIYEPPALLSEVDIKDPVLADCIRFNIREQNIVTASNMKKLNCPSGEINSLEGIEVFSGLEKLGLKDNQIVIIGMLEKIRSLEHINLSSNKIVKANALLKLPRLKYLDLRGNTMLDCDSMTGLNPSVEALLPEHCKRN
jgi:Leucine-rich repeat (LRR) protein